MATVLICLCQMQNRFLWAYWLIIRHRAEQFLVTGGCELC